MECPSCRSSAVVQDRFRAENICTRCGLIIAEKIPEAEPEWRYEPGKDTGRADTGTCIDITQHDLGLGTRLSTGGDLSPSWRARLRRLQMWQDRSRASTYEEKSLREALIDLDKLCEDFAIPKGVKSEISLLYRRVKASRLARGRNTWQVLAALALITCRSRGIPRTEGEMVQALIKHTDMPEKIALRGLRQLVKLFIEKMKLSMPRLRPDDLLDRFASKINLPKQTIVRAQKICDKLPEKLKRAKPPTLLAATVLYVAAKETGIDMTMRKIAATLNVGTSSISQTAALIKSSANHAE
jgi:transcription initiation factor TFIIB